MEKKTWHEIFDDWEWEQVHKLPDYLQSIYWTIKRNVSKYYWDIREYPRRFYERRTKGFDYRDMWSLDIPIAKFIAPRLREFRDHYGSAPMDFYEQDPNDPSGINTSDEAYERADRKWKEVLDKMLYSWEHLAKYEDWDLSLEGVDNIVTGDPKYEEWKTANYDVHLKKMEEGFALFAKFLGALRD